jgi:serine/threonine protein kinase
VKRESLGGSDSCCQFVHEHLVRLIGVVTLGDPLMVVLEYCEHGALGSYLKTTDVSEETKVRFFFEELCVFENVLHCELILWLSFADPVGR